MILLKGGIVVNYNETIGANIRYERRQRGLTIDEFAKVINMAPGFVGLIERGQRGTSMSNIVKIADFFNSMYFKESGILDNFLTQYFQDIVLSEHYLVSAEMTSKTERQQPVIE